MQIEWRPFRQQRLCYDVNNLRTIFFKYVTESSVPSKSVSTSREVSTSSLSSSLADESSSSLEWCSGSSASRNFCMRLPNGHRLTYSMLDVHTYLEFRHSTIFCLFIYNLYVIYFFEFKYTIIALKAECIWPRDALPWEIIDRRDFFAWSFSRAQGRLGMLSLFRNRFWQSHLVPVKSEG